MDLQGKKVAVLGAGKSGICAAQLAVSRGAASVSAFDSGAPEKLRAARENFAGAGVNLITGGEALHPREEFDYAVISPGIDANWPLGKAFAAASGELIGEIEFAWRLSGGDAPVIAVTGTNGKTTVTELTAHLLNQCGKRAVAAGNYGYAYSDLVRSGESYDWVVLEVSSFQLETIVDFHPAIAVWMNFASDHMDRYENLEDYREAKLRIFENQTEADRAILKLEDRIEVAAARTTFSAFSEGGDYSYRDKHIVGPGGEALLDFSKTRLNGKHNAENAMAALAAVHFAGVDFSKRLVSALNQYDPPPHRCEVVGEKDGVIFVNDSKATNLHALESALRGQDEAVTLIVGGKKKGLDYRELNDVAAEKVAAAVCIGETAENIVQSWEGLLPCFQSDSLEDAVFSAWKERGETSVILFSPGTSSFDMFQNYEARGDCFRKAVAKVCK